MHTAVVPSWLSWPRTVSLIVIVGVVLAVVAAFTLLALAAPPKAPAGTPWITVNDVGSGGA